jgi:peroxiredoxin Q/BCP
LRDRFPELEKAGVDLVLVACQNAKALEAFAARERLPFPVVADEDRSIAKAWGVYVAVNYESIHIARPATFAVDAGGIVRYAKVSRSQFSRAKLDDVLAAFGG